MHFLLKSALRSLSDNSQRDQAVPWVDIFFLCKYWMPSRRFVQFVHTQFAASKATEVTGCAVLRTPRYKANPGTEAKENLS